MHYIYIIKAIKYQNKTCVGYTDDIQSRLAVHNNGQSKHTAKYKPWELISYIAFQNKKAAKTFEAYLKSGSGRAFVKRHIA